jgi:hypothetical protein
MKPDRSKPSCVSCGSTMRFARNIRPRCDLRELETFECRDCGLSVTAESVAAVFAMAELVPP